MASLLDTGTGDTDPSSTLLNTGGGYDVGGILDFLRDQGQQIQNESLRGAGVDPSVVGFHQQLLAEHPELRLPQLPAPPEPGSNVDRLGGGAALTTPGAVTLGDPGAQTDAANRQFGGNLGMTVGSTFEGGLRAPGGPLMVSTRIPFAKGLDYDPHQTSDLIINQAAMQADPKSPGSFEKNMALLTGYPGVPPNIGDDPASIAARMRDLWTGNVGFVRSLVPQDVQDFSKDWYRSAHSFTNQLADQYGVSPQAAAGVAATLSPKYDWDQNADLAHRVINIWTQHQDTGASSDMASAAQRMFPNTDMSWLRPGTTLSDVSQLQPADTLAQAKRDSATRAGQWIRAYDETNNPTDFRMQSPIPGQTLDFKTNLDGSRGKLAWQTAPAVADAVSILQDDSLPNISDNLGGAHKVRNFYNNIVDPDNTRGDVTVDTHQIAGNVLLPIGQKDPLVAQGLGSGGGASSSSATGAKGLFGLHADATRAAAGDDELPREAQSITWTGLKGLFQGQKTERNLADALNVWHDYSAGRISADDARNLIADQFAPQGLKLPPWYQGAKDQLAAAGVGGVPPERVGGGTGGAAAGAPPGAGLAVSAGGPGVSPGVGSPDLSGLRAATRLIPPPGYAAGGLIDGPPSGAVPIGGLVPQDPNAGQDGLTAPLPRGGFVLPADTVSLLGNGDAQRGGAHLDRMLAPRAPLSAPATMGRVSSGEYVLDPRQLRGLDDGQDPEGAISLLNDVMERGRRGHSPRTLRGLLAP